MHQLGRALEAPLLPGRQPLHQTREPSVGALLPCNVVLWAEGDATHVEFMDPLAAMGLTGSDAVAAVAAEANEKLRRVNAALEAAA